MQEVKQVCFVLVKYTRSFIDLQMAFGLELAKHQKADYWGLPVVHAPVSEACETCLASAHWTSPEKKTKQKKRKNKRKYNMVIPSFSSPLSS